MEQKMMQLNFYKKTGLAPRVYVFCSNYKTGVVYGLQLWWSALTLTFYKEKS